MEAVSMGTVLVFPLTRVQAVPIRVLSFVGMATVTRVEFASVVWVGVVTHPL